MKYKTPASRAQAAHPGGMMRGRDGVNLGRLPPGVKNSSFGGGWPPLRRYARVLRQKQRGPIR